MLHNLKNGDKVWNILTDDEKMALSLQLVQNKSTWQAGEILGRSHYKYLEIYGRAKEFVRLFGTHFKTYDHLVDKQVSMESDLKQFFINVMQHRMSLGQATRGLSHKIDSAKLRNQLIIKYYTKWSKSEYRAEQEFLELILHFDRWNNFRILPEDIQEPHAFKRRNKKRFKKHIQLHEKDFNKYCEGRLKKLLMDKVTGSPKRLYTVIIKDWDSENGKYELLEVKNCPNNINLVNSYCLYLFRKKEEAQEYGNLLLTFKDTQNGNGENRKVKEGLVFWPQYRALIRMAYNYDNQQKIIPTRKYYEMMQQDDFDFKQFIKYRDKFPKRTENKD